MKYDYYKNVIEDIENWIENELDEEESPELINRIKACKDSDELYDIVEELNAILWTEDSVTGNGSGSYFFDSYKAEEAVCHNWGLLKEACDELSGDKEKCIDKGAEYCDVLIRCYLLIDCIKTVVNNINGYE